MTTMIMTVALDDDESLFFFFDDDDDDEERSVGEAVVGSDVGEGVCG